MGLEPFSDELLAEEIQRDENWKFEYYEADDYISQRNDSILIGSIRSIEALLAHDNIAILRRIEKVPDGYYRRTVGVIGFKHQLPDKETLLLEDRQHVQLERSPTADFDSKLFYQPHHWIEYRDHLATVNRRWGGYLQINSLVTDKQFGLRYLNYLIGGSYWHGLFTNGPVVMPGETFLGETVTTPTIYSPIYYVLEGYDSRARLWREWSMRNLLVGGLESLPDFHQPNRSFSVMGTDAASYWVAIQKYLRPGRGQPAFRHSLQVGGLSLSPPYSDEIPWPTHFSLGQYGDPLQEMGARRCAHSVVAMAEKPSSFPFFGWKPKVHSLR